MKTFIIAIAAVLVASMAHAARPVPGTCGPTFQSLKQLGGASLGQDRCKDGLITPIRTNPLLCRCQHTCDWDDGSRRTTCSPCPGTSNYYEDELTKPLCEEHGGVDDSQWYVPNFAVGYGMWQGPTSTLTVGALPGPDKVTCECMNGDKSACIDTDAGAQVSGSRGTPTWSSALCHDVCGWKGTLSNTAFITIGRDDPSCVGAESPDRGPEVHCMCDGAPLPDTWCTDDATICEQHGCVLHHTSDRSNRCIPVPGAEPTTTTTLAPEPTTTTTVGGVTTTTLDEWTDFCDVDCDNKVGIFDALIVLKRAVGEIEHCTCSLGD
jgi:hypothetical protein